ncbi:MAG: hypothetical protein JKP92_07150 [Alphaproteobacteria bacterium]|nr:hypothetical protein [Alphaproteobacteria bacterium]
MTHKRLTLLLALALCAQGAVWLSLRHEQARWPGTPPVPRSAGALALGDAQLAYRIAGLTLQNMGDMGGNTTPLSDYDYSALGRWFALMDAMDPRANFAPYLAAYYFGGTQNPQDLGPIVDYLARVGTRPEPPGPQSMKWRWLAQGVFLARYRMKDMPLARSLARDLSALAVERGDLPIWARNMEAMVASAMGEKEAALGLLLALLKDGAQNLDPTEVNATVEYLCRQVFTADEAAQAEICAGVAR